VTWTSAARVRLLVAAFALALVLAAFLAAGATGSGNVWTAYLAPGGTCAGATDRAARPRKQARSIRCLVNWARAHAQTSGLRPSRELRKAAVLKGRGVASCRQLSHTPCNTDVTAAVRRAGYPFAMFGENLFAGMDHQVSANDVVTAWLQSPPHRANIMRPDFMELGLAGVPAQGLFGEGTAVVWVAAFGARR
jgi:uncharacterized protein YkwD